MTEVINATLHRIDNPQCSVDELIAHVPAPDFPTGGILCSAARRSASVPDRAWDRPCAGSR